MHQNENFCKCFLKANIFLHTALGVGRGVVCMWIWGCCWSCLAIEYFPFSALSGECLLADQTGAVTCAYNFDSGIRYWLGFWTLLLCLHVPEQLYEMWVSYYGRKHPGRTFLSSALRGKISFIMEKSFFQDLNFNNPFCQPSLYRKGIPVKRMVIVLLP